MSKPKEPQKQIPLTLFNNLVRYFISGDHTCEPDIKAALLDKYTSENARLYYSEWQKYKDTDPARAEKARQNYAEIKGIPKDFRW